VYFDVAEGDIVGLVGRNGGGKTTLLRTISGLVPHSPRQILWMGKPLAVRPDKVARSGIVHVPEGRGVIPNLTTRDSLRLGCVAAGQPFDRGALDATLQVFPRLADLLDKAAGLLSGGEQQMLAIARGMITQPRLLMVDELSLGLAPKVAGEILLALIRAARSSHTSLILVDEDIETLEAQCDRVYHVRSGRMTEWKTSDEDHAWDKLFIE
jgi:branched-chain amino acid transport system ATP-binding protein